MLLLLTGCILFDTSATDARLLALTDRDGDGLSLLEEDCDDADPDIYPGAPEVCDGKDNDCDVLVDEDGGVSVWCRDEDGDGHGDPSTLSHGCDTPATAVLICDDCDDADGVVHPGATETCDARDEDCDGDATPSSAEGASVWYRDDDGDAWGDPSRTETACEAPAGYTSTPGDCDDGEPTVHPEATEVCIDGLDNDCDGTANGCGLSGDYTALGSEVSVSEGGYIVGPEADVPEVLGYSTLLGDTSGDGLPDPILTGFGDLYGPNLGGLVATYWGSPQGRVDYEEADFLVYGPDWSLVGGDYHGALVTDVDGDGISELLVSAPGEADGLPSSGGIYRYEQGRSGEHLLGPSDLWLAGRVPGEWFGDSLSRADDMYGGRPSLLVGASANDSVASGGGALYLLDLEDPAGEPLATVYGTTASLYFGMIASSVVDVDGDGVGDVAVASVGGTESSAVWLFHGPLSGVLTADDADAVLLGGADNGLNDSVQLVDELGADGLGQLVAGGWGPVEEGGDGAAYIVSGSVVGSFDIEDAATVRLRGEDGGSGKVEAVESGDVNGDGQADLLVGSNGYVSSTGALDAGALYLLYGPVTYTGVVEMSDVADARWYGGAEYLEIGFSIATGDTNNDEHDDILVCANPPDGTHRTGGAFFYYGEGI